MNDNKQNLPKVMGERLLNGLFKENPTFVLLLGMCPTLAVTTSAMNGLGMMLFQGAAAFKMWTGHDMPIEHMKEVLGIRYGE